MLFRNRRDAGRQLASCLAGFANRDDVIVLGVPRGGVVVAFEVASFLKVPMDVFVLRKLGVPGHDELAFGAIGGGGVRVLNASVVDHFQLSELEIAAVTQAESEELHRRERLYRGDRPELAVRGRTVLLVDDGIATGSSLLVAVHAIRKLRPAAVVFATPDAPRGARDRFIPEVDPLICVRTPEPFYGVGQFYADFSQVSDEEVVDLLRRAFQLRAKEQRDESPGAARATLS